MQSFISLLSNHVLLSVIIGTCINIALTYGLFRYYVRISRVLPQAQTTPQSPIAQLSHPTLAWLSQAGMRLWQRPVLVYSMVMAIWFMPLLISGQVILPFRPFLYANLEPATHATYVETMFYADYMTAYIPEVNQQMHAPKSGWITLWTNTVEFGKPLAHGSIFSPAYLPSWFMLQFTNNPYYYFTLYFGVIVYLTGLFALLYAREIIPQPEVALLTGLLLAFMPAFFYWNTFHTFITPTTWGMALLYGLQRIHNQKSSQWAILFVGFAMYSLIYTAYPQLIIQIAYILLGYFGWHVWQLRTNRDLLIRYALRTSIGILLGIISTLPFILDLVTSMQLSSLRQQITPQFFISVIPKINTIIQALGAWLSFGVSDIFQPITTYTKTVFPIKSSYITFVMLLFVHIGVITHWRRVWGWVLWLIIAMAFSFRQDIFALGYFAGLPQVSRGMLFNSGSQQIPLIILAMYGAYTIISRTIVPSRNLILITFFGGIQYIGCAVIYALWQHIAVQWTYVALEFGVVLLFTTSFFVTHAHWRSLLLVATIMGHAQFVVAPLLLVQPPTNTITTSPTAQAIVDSLPPDGIMALITQKPTFRLEPNFSSALGIRQIGAYSSLQSRYYVALMKRFNVNYDTYIRTVRSINLPLPANDLWMTNIRTIVSDKPLEVPELTFTTRVNGLYLYHTADGMGCCLRVPARTLRTDSTTPNHYWLDHPQANTNQRLTKKVDHGDELLLEFPAATEDSVIVFNQQFHPDWIAHVQTAQGWQPTRTITINDVYQAVHIPAGATALNFQFRPWIRWSIVANLFWLILSGIWLYPKITHMYQAWKTLRTKNILV